MNIFKKIGVIATCLSFVLLGWFFAQKSFAQNVALPSPTFIEVVSGPKVYITGTTVAGSEVMVYFDNIFAGLANVNNSADIPTRSFYFAYSGILAPGQHKITLQARDKITLVLSPISETRYLNAPNLSAPVLYEPNSSSIVTALRPTIKGATVNNTYIYLYLDGVFLVKTHLLVSGSGKPYIVYQVPNNLSIGWHNAYAYAENINGERSLISNIINFRINEPMITPTLRRASLINNKIEVTGVAANSSILSFVVDGQPVNGKFKVGSHSSGAVGFKQAINVKLAKGQHSVCLIASDKNNKTSNCSNKIYVTAGGAAITKKAVAEKSEETIANEKKTDTDRDGLTNYEEIYIYHTNAKKADTDGDGYNDKVEIDNGYNPLVLTKKDPKYLALLEKIDSDKDDLSDYLEIYVYRTNPERADTDGDGYNDKIEVDNGYNPLVPSNKDKKSIKAAAIESAKLEVKKVASIVASTTIAKTETTDKTAVAKTDGTNSQNEKSSSTANTYSKNNLQINLIIFLVFLVGIIVWIVWVNRELIKERSRQNKVEAIRKENEREE